MQTNQRMNITKGVQQEVRYCAIIDQLKKTIRKAENYKNPKILRKISSEVKTSHCTVRRILQDKGFEFKLNKRVIINSTSRNKRVSFDKKMTNDKLIWQSIFFSDEMSIWLSRAKPSGNWVNKNRQMDIEHQLNSDRDSIGRQGIKVHVLVAISTKGAKKLEIFEHNMNAQIYIAILKKRKKEMDSLNPNGYIFKQDGRSVHRSDASQKYLKRAFGDSILE
ncbi:hypothetical protein ABPG72_010230 [Tetrahymena utriculariae]